MRVTIVGVGEVGSNTATSLASDHDVIVVDTDPETIEELAYCRRFDDRGRRNVA